MFFEEENIPFGLFFSLAAIQRRQLERNEFEGGGGMGGVYGAVTNMLVIGGFAAFALIVQYVLQSIANTD